MNIHRVLLCLTVALAAIARRHPFQERRIENPQPLGPHAIGFCGKTEATDVGPLGRARCSHARPMGHAAFG
jgi:hypothetical protein